MVFCNIDIDTIFVKYANSHNPYFNRWFSAIPITVERGDKYEKSQSLF